jgi:hypothetical protein
MTCEEFLRLLDEDRLAGSPEAAAHLQSCPECRYAKEWWHTVRRELRELKDEPTPPFLHTRVMAHVRAGATQRAPWWQVVPRLSWTGPALVGVVLLVASGYGLWQVMRPSATPPGVPAPRESSGVVAGGAESLRRDAAGADAKLKEDEVAERDKAQDVAQPKEVAPAALTKVETAAASVGNESEAGAPGQNLEGTFSQQRLRLAQNEPAVAEKQVASALEQPAVRPSSQFGQNVLSNQANFAQTPAQNVQMPPANQAANVATNVTNAGAVAQNDQRQAAAQRVEPERTSKGTRDEESRATQGQAKSAPAPATQSVAESLGKGPSTSNLVTCAVVAQSGGALRGIALPPELAPPAGAPVEFTVGADRSVAISISKKTGGAGPLATALASLELPIGRYTLRRVGK